MPDQVKEEMAKKYHWKKVAMQGQSLGEEMGVRMGFVETDAQAFADGQCRRCLRKNNIYLIATRHCMTMENNACCLSFLR